MYTPKYTKAFILGVCSHIADRFMDTSHKIDYLWYVAACSNAPSIVCLTETKLKKTVTDNEIVIPGYYVFFKQELP